MEARNQPAVSSPGGIVDKRHDPRFRLQVEIKVNSKTSGVLKGCTADISESGISAMLKLEVPIGEFVELQFTLPYGPVTVYATTRQRSAFRYGFQFAESPEAREIIRATCRSLEIEQSTAG